MQDLSLLKSRLIEEGNMTPERAEEALAYLIEKRLPLRFMVDAIIVKRTGGKLDIKHVQFPPGLDTSYPTE